jgi:hypothetical protein
MLYYLPLFLIFCLASIVETLGIPYKKRELLLAAITMFAVLFIGLRYYTGADWNLYITHFTQSLSMGNAIGFENGYYFLSKFILLNTGNYYILQLLASCFILISAMYFFKNNSKYPVFIFSIFVFVFFGALMAQIRQTIALGFIFISARYVFERKFLLFLLIVTVACLFHISATIALPLYFLNKNYGKILPIILVLAAQTSYLYPHSLISFVEAITPYLPGRLSVISNNYLTKATFFIQGQEVQSGSYYIARILLIIFLIAVIKPKNDKELFFINTLAMAALIKGLSMGMGILERFVDYYLIFGIAAYPLLMNVQMPKLFSIKDRETSKNSQIRDLTQVPKLLTLSNHCKQSLLSLNRNFRVLDVAVLRISNKLKSLIVVCLLIAFFAIPFCRSITSDKISELNGRPGSYRYIPYYNVLYHPDEASQRKDWNE